MRNLGRFTFQCREAVLLGFALALALALGAAPGALAQPDQSGSTIINSPGFPSVCDAPCYSVQKDFQVWLAGNNTGPIACGAGENLFVYQLTHLGGTLPFPSVAITEFEVTVDASIVGSAGFIPGANISPIATTIQPIGAVGWDFPDSTACPGCLDQGKSSDLLFICSTGAPALRPDIVSTTAGIDAQGECVVPVAPACDIGVDKKCCVAEADDDETSDSDSSSDERPGDNCAERDDDDKDSDSENSDGTGTPFTDSCTAKSGDTVVYQYVLTNPNPATLNNVSLSDDVLGPIDSMITITPGETKVRIRSKVLFGTTTNKATATGDLATGGQCSGSDSVTVTVP